MAFLIALKLQQKEIPIFLSNYCCSSPKGAPWRMVEAIRASGVSSITFGTDGGASPEAAMAARCSAVALFGTPLGRPAPGRFPPRNSVFLWLLFEHFKPSCVHSRLGFLAHAFCQPIVIIRARLSLLQAFKQFPERLKWGIDFGQRWAGKVLKLKRNNAGKSRWAWNSRVKGLPRIGFLARDSRGGVR
jgi:hypothetical protein